MTMKLLSVFAAPGRPCVLIWALTCVLATWLMVASFPAVGFAQEATTAAEPTERQLELNDQGVRAIIREDYERAVALLEESLVLGDWNITRLNLGRAYQKLGNCFKAKQTLEAARSAPPVADPPPDVVAAKAAKFLGELDEQCTESDYLPDAKDPADDGPASRPAADATSDSAPDSARGTWGWVSVASGVALLAGGGTMHLLAEAERDEVRDAPQSGGVRQVKQADIADYESRANTFDTVGLSMAITGGVVAGFGAYLLFSNPDSSAPESDSPDRLDEPAVSLGVLPGGGLVTYTVGF